MTISNMEMSNPAWLDFSFNCPFCSQKVETNTDVEMWFCLSCHAVFSFNVKRGVIHGTQIKLENVELPEMLKAVLRNKRRRKS